jgi:uncharacterized protein YkwD
VTWVTPAKSRFTRRRGAAPPIRGSERVRVGSYGASVRTATTAAPSRVVLTALLAAALAALTALAFTGSADGGARTWSSYLAPPAACKGSTDAAAPAAMQQRAVACLLNWARSRAQRGKLSPSASLQRAAGLKGKKVVSCGDFSHTPCGSSLVGAVNAAGYRYASFGENLYVGPWGGVSARDVVAAWLESPGHRENVLRPGFRHVGAALVRGQGLVNAGPEAVWIATFASPR